jgi:polysaccharide deacetylase 2 family uncharacterized protein YibQ
MPASKKSSRKGARRPASRRRKTRVSPLMKALGALAVLAAAVIATVVVSRFLWAPQERPALTEKRKAADRPQRPASKAPGAENRSAAATPAQKAPTRADGAETPSEPKVPPYEVFPAPAEPPAAEDNGPLHAALPPTPPELPPLKKLPRVAIIIDDLGYDRRMAERLMELDPGLTVAILPHSPHQQAIAGSAHARGMEIMLHLPMEPREYPEINPGPGTLLTAMEPDELLRVLEGNLAAVPHVKGVNNHMGSRLTASSEQIYQVFSVLKRRGLFFVDSRTTDDSICRASARLFQIPFAQRDVFLDHVHDPAFIRRQIRELVRIAQRRGEAVGIAHPNTTTYTILKEELPALRQQVELVPASRLVRVIG